MADGITHTTELTEPPEIEDWKVGDEEWGHPVSRLLDSRVRDLAQSLNDHVTQCGSQFKYIISTWVLIVMSAVGFAITSHSEVAALQESVRGLQEMVKQDRRDRIEWQNAEHQTDDNLQRRILETEQKLLYQFRPTK